MMEFSLYMVHNDKQRFYWLSLQQDLFGTWCVRKSYGGLKNNHRRDVWTPYDNQLQASKELAEIEYKRRQRGYVYQDIAEVDLFALTPQLIQDV